MLPPWRRFEALPLASKLARLGATALDTAAIAPFIVAAATLVVRKRADLAIAPALVSLLVLFYQSQLMAAAGQTLGKRAFGIQVLLRDGSRIESFTVVMRMWVPMLIVGAPILSAAVLTFGGVILSVFAPGFDAWLPALRTTELSAVYMIFTAALFAASIFSEDNRTFADRLADTEVVVAPPTPKPVKHWRMLLFSLALVIPVVAIMFTLVLLVLGIVLLAAAIFYSYWLGHRGQ